MGSVIQMNKFTKGPWRVDNINPGVVRINNDPSCGILVGQKANAKLIANAPQMHALLVESLKYLMLIEEVRLVKLRTDILELLKEVK